MHLHALDDAAWDSPWRRVRVVDKVALSGALVMTALVGPAWPVSPLVAVAAAGLALGSARIPVRALGFAMAAPLTFLVIGGVSVAVVLGGTPPVGAWTLGPLWADADSAIRGLSAFAHGVSGTLAVMLLATTTPMVDLLGWLRRLGVPAPLVEIASLTYRLLFVLLSTAIALHAAQTARLGSAHRGWSRFSWGLRNAATTMGTLLLRTGHRTLRLQAGLEGRGYVDDLRTLPPLQTASRAFLVMAACVLAGIWAIWALTAWLGG